jgi:hypothetical protein
MPVMVFTTDHKARPRSTRVVDAVKQFREKNKRLRRQLPRRARGG